MRIVALAAALLLSACAEPKYMWSKPGSSTFSEDSAGCKADIDRRLKAAPPVYFLKDGNHYQGSGEWAQRTYNECMRTLGYTPTREITTADAPAPRAVTSTLTLPSSATTTMAGRLRELRGLLDQGLITQGEYDQRRQAILSSL